MSVSNFFYLDLGVAIQKATSGKPLEKEFSSVESSFSSSRCFVAETIASRLGALPEYYVSEEEEAWKDKFVESFELCKATEGELSFIDSGTGCSVKAKFFSSICLILWTNEVGGLSLSCIDLTGGK